MTNLVLGIGLLVTNCNGQLMQRWTNVPCTVFVQKTVDGQEWCTVMRVYWDDCPGTNNVFELPLKSREDRAFYRLVVP